MTLAMDKQTVIDLDGVGVLRADRWILKDVTWQVRPGEHWVVLGANGSGKTTMLQVVASYLYPTEGRVQVAGHVFGKSDLRELKKHVGWVSPAVATHIGLGLDAESLVALGADGAFVSLEGVPSETREKARERLAEVDMESLADQPYRVLSTGEQQRALIARSLMADPTVLVLDEPFTGLDFPTREKTMAVLQDLAVKRTALTILMVTHHVEEIVPAISHGILLKDGRVQAAGLVVDTVTSGNLTEAFSVPIQVRRAGGRFEAHVELPRV